MKTLFSESISTHDKYLQDFDYARKLFLTEVKESYNKKKTAYEYIDRMVKMYKEYHKEIPNLHHTFFRIAMDLTEDYDLDVEIVSEKCGGCH